MATKKDFEQVIKLVYDEDNNALKVTGGTTINALRDIADVPATDPYPNSQFLGTDVSGNLVWKAGSGTGMNDLVEDLTPQLGGDLDVNGHAITAVSNLQFTPGGSFDVNSGSDIYLDCGASGYVWVTQTQGLGMAVYNDLFMLNGDIRSDQANGDIRILPDGTGSVIINGTTIGTGQVTTTTATASTIKSLATTTNKVYWFRANFCGRRTDVAGNICSMVLEGTIKNIAGTVTIESIQKTVLVQDDATYDVSASVNATSIDFQVTGQTAHTLDWNVQLNTSEV